MVSKTSSSPGMATASIANLAKVVFHQTEKAVFLAAVQPDDGGEVGELLRRKVVDLARDLAVDVARIEHQHLVAARGRFGAVEVPQLAGDGAGVEEVGADGDHHVHVAGLDDLPAHLLLAVPGAGGLRGHDEAGAARWVQVAAEVGNPEVVAVGDLLVLVHARQAEGQAPVVLDLLGVHQVHVERRIGHHEVALARGRPSCKRCASS